MTTVIPNEAVTIGWLIDCIVTEVTRCGRVSGPIIAPKLDALRFFLDTVSDEALFLLNDTEAYNLVRWCGTAFLITDVIDGFHYAMSPWCIQSSDVRIKDGNGVRVEQFFPYKGPEHNADIYWASATVCESATNRLLLEDVRPFSAMGLVVLEMGRYRAAMGRSLTEPTDNQLRPGWDKYLHDKLERDLATLTEATGQYGDQVLPENYAYHVIDREFEDQVSVGFKPMELTGKPCAEEVTAFRRKLIKEGESLRKLIATMTAYLQSFVATPPQTRH
jgi:hypothetical protein